MMTARSKMNRTTEQVKITGYLRDLRGAASRLIEGKAVSLTDARRMAGFLAEIRQLLSEWADVENRAVPARPIAEEVRVLRERFLELEGMVKEIRNTLERNSGGMKPVAGNRRFPEGDRE
jgi:hypothetical protein